MAKLTTKSRKALPKQSFAVPAQRSYPIPDQNHARLALAMVSRYGNPAQQAEVRAAVKKKYPGIT
jgi:hypothetical protein